VDYISAFNIKILLKLNFLLHIIIKKRWFYIFKKQEKGRLDFENKKNAKWVYSLLFIINFKKYVFIFII